MAPQSQPPARTPGQGPPQRAMGPGTTSSTSHPIPKPFVPAQSVEAAAPEPVRQEPIPAEKVKAPVAEVAKTSPTEEVSILLLTVLLI